ncbi:MAG TPA: protein kinase, partial [Gemmataceae bacterium]|nr:protein kinase [Gemmataceae bacterium]
ATDRQRTTANDSRTAPTGPAVSPHDETHPPSADVPPPPPPAALKPARHPLLLGTRVGPYTVLECLGQGGMGIVYKARHHSLSRMSALKMMLISGNEVTPEYLSRFRKDADSLAQLEHPHIVRVYDYDHDEACGPYFALEYVEGGTLAARLKIDTRWDFRRAARLVETLARATHVAHENHIVHRDLKPANVLLSPLPRGTAGPGGLDFVPKITDFGLAKTCTAVGNPGTLPTEQNLTFVGTVMGTPAYMAPEQAEGRPDVDRRADVYALGATLYELLTGRPPFNGSATEVLLQVRNFAEPPPVRPYRADVPPELEDVCLKCLQRDPAKRYATAAELADALTSWLEAEPSGGKWPSAPPTMRPGLWPTRIRGAVRRHPARSALVALGALLVCVGAIVTIYRATHRPPAEPVALLEEAKKHVAQAEAALKEQDRVGAIGKLAAAQDDYTQLAAAYPGRPRYRIKVAELLNRQGSLRCDLRDWKMAEQTFRDALEALKPLHGTEEARRDRTLQEAEALHGLGSTYSERDDTDGGYPALRANWETARDFFSQSLDKRKYLREDAEGDDKLLPAINRDLARGYGYLGDTFLKLGQVPVARTAYRRAEQIRQKLAETAPDDLDAQMQLARSYANTGRALERQGKPEAVKEYLKAHDYLGARMEQYAAAANPPPEFRLDYAYYCNAVASLLMDQGQPAEGKRVPDLLTEARETYEPPAKEHPDDSFLVSGLAETYLLLGRYHLATDREAARKELQQATRLLGDSRLRLGPDDLLNRALVRVLLSQLAEDPSHKAALVLRADDSLEQAHQAGYNNLGRL